MKQILALEDVRKAIDDLKSQGKKATLAAVHAALNHRGSMSTLVRLKAEIDAAAQPADDSTEGLKVFREVWALAVQEGRTQLESQIADLRESIKALAGENERLEGVTTAAQNRATVCEEAKKSMEGELHQTQISLAEASTRAADALQKLSTAQESHSVQVDALQAELTAAVNKAHDFELQLVRALALAEADSTKKPKTPTEATTTHKK